MYQGHEYASGSECARVLNKPGIWIYQGSEYASSSEFARILNTRLVLNLPGFWIRVRVLNISGLHRVLNMSEYSWLCLAEYAWICLNIPKSAWMAFVLYFSIVISCLLEGVVTYFNVYARLEVLVWMKTRLFSCRDNLI